MTRKYPFKVNDTEYSASRGTILGMAFVVLMLCYGILTQMHFSTDAYYTLFDMRPEGHLGQGRFTIFFIIKVLTLFGVNSVVMQRVFTFLFLLLLAVSSTVLFDCLYTRINHSLGSVCGMLMVVLLSFTNIYYLELFLFPEMCLYWGIGTLLTIYAVKLTQNRRPLSWCIAYLLLLLGLGVYQAMIGLYVIWCTTCAILERKVDSGSHFYKNYVKCLLIGGTASMTSIAVPKLIQMFGGSIDTLRSAGLSHLVENAILLIKEQKSVLIDGSSLYPKYTLILVLIFAIGLFLYGMGQEKGNKGWGLMTVLVLVTNYAIIFAPHLVAGYVWLSPRAIIPMGSFAASLLLLALQWMPGKTTILFIAVVQLFAIYQNLAISVDHFSTNRLDQEYARLLETQIEKYEVQSGIEVRNIAVRTDTSPQWKYEPIRYMAYNVNERAYLNEWSDVTLLNYVSGRGYNKIGMPDEIYQEYFANKNWDAWCPEEQLVFEGDTLYWVKY